MDVYERAIEIAVERMQRVRERQQVQEEVPQEELRSAYERVIMSQEFDPAYDFFVQQYGQDAWENQVRLHIRRSQNA